MTEIIAKIKCENLLTGEVEEYEILASAPAKTETLQQLTIKKQALRKTLSELRRIFGNGLFWT